MVKSMTGYGRAQQTVAGRDITVEIKSVNHRFFEFSARVSRSYGYLEEKLKAAVYGKVSRGKVEVAVTTCAVESGAVQVEINHDLARSYLDSIRNLGRELMLDDDVTLTSLTRFSDIFVVRKTEEDADLVWQGVSAVLDEALEKFLAMRELEGKQLEEDILGRLAAIEDHVAKVEILSPKTVEEYRARLFSRLSDILADKQLDESRILTEAAIFAEKTAVDEETVRLRSHIGQFREILAQSQPVGRKLDFLVQELNREANTIGSKAQDMEVARIVVEIKSDIEKIREQIQNIE